MPATIDIISLSTDELIIQPISESSRQDPCLYSELKKLKLYLTTCDLIENDDYISLYDPFQSSRSDTIYRLKFPGKSLVLRALYSIPKDAFNLVGFCGFSMQHYNHVLINAALTIRNSECTLYDLKFVKQCDLEMLVSIENEVNKIHNQFHTPSEIMTQLDRDLQFIKQRKGEYSFTVPYYLLALCSLIRAYLTEKDLKTKVKPYVILKGSSLLEPQYKIIYTAVCSLLDKYKKGLDEASALSFYNKHVRNQSMQEHLSFAAPAASNKPTAIQNQNIPMQPIQSHPSNNSNEQAPETEQFGSLFFNTLIADLKIRKVEIQRRINKGQWFQDNIKNQHKIKAITDIVSAFDKGKKPIELFTMIQERNHVLTQSTSTLPRFFRAQVSTAILLGNLPHMTSPNFI